MEQLKVLHFGDLHARDADLEEIKKCAGKIVETAYSEQPDLIIFSGDFFDSQFIRLDSESARLVAYLFAELAEVAPVVAPIGTPSHDGTAATILGAIRAKHHIIVAARPCQVYLWAGKDVYPDWMFSPAIPDAILSLIPTPTKQYLETQGTVSEGDEAIGNMMSSIFAGFGAQAAQWPGVPHILVGHYTTRGCKISEKQTLMGVDIEISYDQMQLARPSVCCLGHIHMHQQIGENVFYSGSPYRCNWGEMEDKGFYLHTLDGDRLINSEFIQTPARKLVRIDEDFTQYDGLDLADTNYSLPEDPEAIRGASVRLIYKVYPDQVELIDKEQTKAFYLDEGAESVEIRLLRQPRITVRNEKVLRAHRLRDKIVEMANGNGGELPAGVLSKADALDDFSPEAIIARIKEGAQL